MENLYHVIKLKLKTEMIKTQDFEVASPWRYSRSVCIHFTCSVLGIVLLRMFWPVHKMHF